MQYLSRKAKRNCTFVAINLLSMALTSYSINLKRILILMKQRNVYRRHNPAHASLAIIVVTTLITCSSFAAEPISPSNDSKFEITGLSEEQKRAVAKAREEQTAKRYNEQEQAAIDMAIGKVNEMTPVTRDTVSMLKVQAMQWPNSSLGCAEPGVEYLQQVIPGYFVSFSVEGKIYTVHIGGESTVICDRVNDYMAKRRERSMAIIKLHEAARVDLAKKLMVKTEEISVTKIQQETWPDASLGCPIEGEQYEPVPVDGLRFNMTCRGKEYEYRAALDGGDFVSCEEIVSCHETE